jgi:murein DD-endopeptidase MepM/ murein hydrolase activator NlpD
MGAPISDLGAMDCVTQPWGCTDYEAEWVRPDCPGGHFHAGIDLGFLDGGNNHLGTPILAARAGTVIALGPLDPLDGEQYLGPLAPCVLSPEGLILEYGHVQAVYVTEGDKVEAGQHIADMGSLGASSGGHLHLEARLDAPIQGPPWAYVLDPTPYLKFPPPAPAPSPWPLSGWAAAQPYPGLPVVARRR